jgi:hypothetical protein
MGSRAFKRVALLQMRQSIIESTHFNVGGSQIVVGVRIGWKNLQGFWK